MKLFAINFFYFDSYSNYQIKEHIWDTSFDSKFRPFLEDTIEDRFK